MIQATITQLQQLMPAWGDDVDEEKDAKFAEFLNENVDVSLYCVALYCVALCCIASRRVYRGARGRR